MFNPNVNSGRVFALDPDRVVITDDYKKNRFFLIGFSFFILAIGFYIITYPPSPLEYAISAVLFSVSIISLIINTFYRTHQREINFCDVESVKLKDNSNTLYFILKEGAHRPVKDLPGGIYNELTYFLRKQGLVVNYKATKPAVAVQNIAATNCEAN